MVLSLIKSVMEPLPEVSVDYTALFQGFIRV